MPDDKRLELIRKFPGREMQTIRALPDDLTRVKCCCCEQTLDIHEAGKKFYEDFKGALVCEVCNQQKPLDSAENLTNYFSGGFPKCCGKTMTWKTQYELEADLP